MPQELTSTRRRRRPAHRAETPSRKRLASIGGLLTTTAIIGAGAFLGLTGVGGTYAMWNGSASSSDATMTAGELTLSVGGGSNPYAIPASSNLFPGDSVMHSVPVTVNNTPSTLSGDVSMKLDASLLYGFDVRVKPGSCPGTAFVDGVLLSTSDQLIDTWGGAQTSNVCVQVSLPDTAPNSVQGKPDDITIVVTAEQQQ